MLKFRNRFLIYLTAVSAGALLISNLAAVKLWNLFGIAVDGGVIVFPLTSAPSCKTVIPSFCVVCVESFTL